MVSVNSSIIVPPTRRSRTDALQSGDRGQAVADLQTALGIEPDGKFGPITRDAVRQFQQQNGLRVTGLADGATLARVSANKASSSSPAETPASAHGWNAATTLAATGYRPPSAAAPAPTAAPVRAAAPLGAPRNAREAAVDAIPDSELVLSGTAQRVKRAGQTTLGNKLPIVKGSYEVVADYTDPKSNHLYVIDKRDHSIVARYVSNGGMNNYTPGGELKVNFTNTRPTWTPTRNELAENPDFRGDGPGPESSMGLVKLNLKGAVYIHGVWDAETDGDAVSVSADQINDLGEAHSHGCWNMSNPNVVELVERFGIDQGTRVTILKGQAGKAKARELDAQMVSRDLGDRPLSAGVDLLREDYAGPGKYLSKTSYTDKNRTRQTDDGWYLRLWQRREKLGV